MDVTIWTKFDREPVYLYGVEEKSANLFAELLYGGKVEFVWIISVSGWHYIKREHVVRAHFSGAVEADYGDES